MTRLGMRAHGETRTFERLRAAIIGVVRMIRVAAGIAAIATIALPSIVVAQDSRSRFLVATPDLRDPLFSQTVVVMIPQTEIQIPLVVGLIINKPTQISV